MQIISVPERPIQSKTEDKLERSRFITRLTSSLVDTETKKSTGVVVGITGPWGSGKSSILNLLYEHLKEQYSEALIVKFDPWLVSGRDVLIAEFLAELIGTINSDKIEVSAMPCGERTQPAGLRRGVAETLLH